MNALTVRAWLAVRQLHVLRLLPCDVRVSVAALAKFPKPATEETP